MRMRSALMGDARRAARNVFGAGAAVIAGYVAAGAAPPCDLPAQFTSSRFVADGWIDEDGLRTLAGIQAPGSWSAERAEHVANRFLETQVFRSVELSLVPAGSAPEECVLVVDLELKPRLTGVNLSGAELPPFAAVRAAWRWLTGRSDRAPAPTEQEVRRLMPLRPGNVYDPELLDRATNRILKRYHAAGYPSASVATQVRQEASGTEIDIEVESGAPRLVTEIELRPSEGTSAEAADIAEHTLRELIGTPEVRDLSRQTRRQIVRRLREEGYFDSQVEVTWEPIDAVAGRLVATVEVGMRQAIVINGNESIDDDDLLPRDELYDRIFLSRNTWRQAARKMEAEYQRRGFYKATVTLESDGGDMVYNVVEGGRFKIVAVEITGNRAIDEKALGSVVETGRGGVLGAVRPPRVVDEVLAEDRERIRVLYVRGGFESATVSSHVALDDMERAATVRFTVEEGPRTYVREVQGAEGLAGIDVVVGAGAVGEPLDIVAVRDARVRLESELRRRGYFDARAKVEIQRQAGASEIAARVVWDIAPGARHTIGDVLIQGNSDTRYVVITRDLPFEAAATVDVEQLSDVQQRIYDSGVFRNVSIAPVDRDDEGVSAADAAEDEDGDDDESTGELGAPPTLDTGERRLAVRVAPRAPGRIAYGAGYDTRQGLTGFGEVSYANINRRAQRLRLRGQIGFDPGDSKEPTQYLLTSEFVEPRLLDGPWTYQLNVLGERNTRAVDQYNIERGSIATGLSREIVEKYHVGADLQVEFARVFDVLPVPFRERDEQQAWTTSLSPFIVYDGRDSVFDPRSGLFESLRVRYAVPGVSNVDLFEVVGQHTQLIPLWRKWGFVYSVRVGWVRSLDGDPIVPIRNRYFVGGGESVRGFAVNSLGPYDGDGSEVGGDLAVVTKAEVRIPLIWELGLVVFVDGGANYLTRCDADCRAGDPSAPETRIRDADVSLDNFRTAAGLGLRYVTPIGPISVDYGIKLDRRTRTLADGSRPQESFGEFSISIGARF